jgi:hypothetical protein
VNDCSFGEGVEIDVLAVLGEIFKDRKDQELKVELRGIASDVEEKLRSCQ